MTCLRDKFITSAFFLFMKLENKIDTPCDSMLSSAPATQEEEKGAERGEKEEKRRETVERRRKKGRKRKKKEGKRWGKGGKKEEKGRKR